MGKESAFATITGLVKQALPLIIIGGTTIAMSQWLLLLLPAILFPILEKVLSWIGAIWKKIMGQSVSYTIEISEYLTPSVLWGLNNHGKSKFKNYSATGLIIKYHHALVTCNTRQILISADPGDKDFIEYKGVRIEVSKTEKRTNEKEESKKVYSLTSENLSVLKEFLETNEKEYNAYIIDQYNKNIDNFDSPMYYNFDLKDKWESCPISVSKNFGNVFLEAEDQKEIVDRVEMLKNNEYYVKSGKPRKVCFLLHGLPGTGKSSTAFAIAEEFKYHIYGVKIGAMHSRHEFIKAVNSIPSRSLVVFEEIDIGISNRTKGEAATGDKDKSILPQVTLQDILEVLDGYTYFKDCIIILTTNYRNRLDDALIRAGRVDYEIEYKNSSAKLVKRIVEYQAQLLGFEPHDVSYEKYANKFASSRIINACENSKSFEQILEKLDKML
ncbi:Cell division protein FtsH [Kaumoebavirus]|uniref:Cell division protein FtsH n=1 Tax=Kaumoebavirus TaxID=1859492 RepID=UPI0009C1C0F5|nr:Cell division protein FtsH [Kaumoebavirus]ARA72230.1 Cell division protein FtsH [Kaumoebavirus]